MAYDLQASTQGLKREVVDAMVKQVAAPSYRFKQALAIETTNAWDNTFYREDPATSSGPTGNAFEGVPWGAEFPQRSVDFSRHTVRIIKFAAEENIPIENQWMNAINVLTRTVIRRTQDVVKAVDDYIWGELTQDFETGQTLSEIQSYAVSTIRAWNTTSAALLDDLLGASRLIANKNYDVSNLICFISPRDKQSIMSWVAEKGAQWPSLATGIVTNGNIGKIGGIQLVEAASVAASYALLVKPQTCATWKSALALTSDTETDPLKSIRFRIAEEGAVLRTDPKAIVLIKGTQDTNA